MKKRFKPILLISIICIIGVSIVGCAKLKDVVGKLKGDLIGQRFTINTYDDYGNKTMAIDGNKVTVGLLQNSDNFDKKASQFKSEVLEVTVNGNQMFQVGNTVIFAEDGLDMIEGYDTPKDVKVSSGGGYVPLDRYVNDVKNKIGKEKTIIISSQQGIPIGVYQGKDVYVTIPEDLPKMTRINIDGKTLYIHRANYTILDSKMLKGK